MMPKRVQGSETIRRILVALDASPQSLAALQAAVELAEALRAELLGIFVEDINLVRLAELPGIREVGVSSARPRPLESPQLERQLRARAARVRRALAQVAERSRIRWSFRVARGTIDDQLLEAAGEADLVILGRAGWSGTGKLGSTAQALLARAPQRALVLEAGERLRPTLMVIYDGSPTAARALATAAEMSSDRRSQLVVVLLAKDDKSAAKLQAQCERLLEAQGVKAQFHRLASADSAEIAQLVQARRDCMLVLPGALPMLQDRPLSQALGAIRCPVLVVR